MEDQAKYRVLSVKRLTNRDIVICYYCKGEGKVRVYNDNPSFDGPYIEKCPVCEGSGRRIVVTITEYMPFK